MASCPICNKPVADTYTVQSSDKTPFTAVASDAMNALSAWGAYDVYRTILCVNEKVDE